VVATNTSALSITELAGAMKSLRAWRACIFFNPVHKMKLVEIVRALDRAPTRWKRSRLWPSRWEGNGARARVAGVRHLARQRAHRQRSVLHAAGRRGLGADIDKALKLGLNHPMGPFELVDLVGLDTRLSILEYLHRSLGDKYRPCPLLAQYVKAGRFGKKVGKGVYEY
jgi:3-hydroxybutyryl-CoA dehydrogenase